MSSDDGDDWSPSPDGNLAGRWSEPEAHPIALPHRSRNVLGMMRSVIRRTVESSETLEDFALHIEGRLDALTRTQSAIDCASDGGVDLATLLATEFMAGQAREDDQVSLDGPSVRLAPRAAMSLGLAFQELTTNAIKYGALSARGGHVSVTWRLKPSHDAHWLAVTWQERGGPRIAAAPLVTGFGTEMLNRTLADELQAETILSYDADGLRCSLNLPFTDHAFARET